MEEKELMIGDWVRSSIDHDEVWQWEVNDYIYIDKDEIEPIPLTPEILEANGFRYKEKDNEWWHYDEFPFSDFQIGYEDEDDKRVIFNIDTTNIKVNYVHKLQHALRLCGLIYLADNFKIE